VERYSALKRNEILTQASTLMKLKDIMLSGHQWHMSVILATQETAIRRIAIQRQPRHRVHEALSKKNLHKKKKGGAGGVP
jgi:hypothetical protein